MIFVVGARRSGTNWLQRIICSQPGVAGVPSESFLFHWIAKMNEGFQHAVPGSPTTATIYVDREALHDGLRDLCDLIFHGLIDTLSPNATRLVERTPWHVLHLGLIGDVYPDARVVNIVRDGRDVVRSLLSQEWGPATVEEAAEEWRAAIAAARELGPRLAHYHEVRYEELLAEPERVVSELFTWLGIDASTEAVERGLAEARIAVNIDPGSPRVAVGKWRDAFSETDLRTFSRVAGATLADLGYDGGELGGPRDRGAGSGVSLKDRARDAAKRIVRGRGFHHEALRTVTRSGELLDRALGCLALRDFERLGGLMDPTAYVRVADPANDWDGRGADDIRRFLEYLSGDPALRGRTIRGDVHPAIPTCTALLAYGLPDGTTETRMLAVTIDGDRITRFVYYRLPAEAGSPSASLRA